MAELSEVFDPRLVPLEPPEPPANRPWKQPRRVSEPTRPGFDKSAVSTHVEMLHTLASNAEDDGVLLLVRIEQNAQMEKSTVKTERFSIGDEAQMIAAIMAHAGTPNLNLYAPWAVLRRDIEPNKKGGEQDVLAVLAFVADLDNDTGKGGGRLPLEAPYTIETSAGNAQSIFPVAKPLSAAAAKPLAIALADAIKCDSRSKDVSGIWRIPGTLNWPTKTKLDRGRSAAPQLVTVSTPWTGELIEPETLESAFAQFIRPDAKERKAEDERSSSHSVPEMFAALPADLKKLIAGPPFPGEDQSQTAASVFSKLRRRGLSDADIEVLVRAHPEGIGKRYAEGKDLTADLKRTAEKWADATPADTIFDPWDRYAVPALPLNVLPSAVANFVAAQSAVIGCDPSALAMAALTAFSAALDHRFALKMMKNGDWWASPRLWLLLVGDPSRKKTPIINAATHELGVQQSILREKYEQQKQLHLAAGGDPKNGPLPPPRFVSYDPTVEKLGELLARYDRGILIKRDEFAGFLGAMERYGKGGSADRAFWLSAFDGGPYTVDRINRGETLIRNLSVSLIGGIQPERLAELRGLTSDGLLQRFLPVMMGPSSFTRDTDNLNSNYRLLIGKLLWLKPRKYLLSNDALGEMEGLRRHLHELQQSAGGLANGFQAFVGKLEGYAGSLALILHMIEDANQSIERVSAETVSRVAILVREFILPHALEFYKANERASAGDRLQRLASWILTSGKTRFVPSDFTSNIADLKGLSLWDLNQRISPLIAGGWLMASDIGPITRSWLLAPGVTERFKQQAAIEEQRKAQLAYLMASPRKMGRQSEAR